MVNPIVLIDGYTVNANHITQMWINGPWERPKDWHDRSEMRSNVDGKLPKHFYADGLCLPFPAKVGQNFRFWTGKRHWFGKYSNFCWILESQVLELNSWFLHVELTKGHQIEKGTYAEVVKKRDELVSLIQSLQMECKFNVPQKHTT